MNDHFESYLPSTEDFVEDHSQSFIVVPIGDMVPDEVLTAEEWGELVLKKGSIVNSLDPNELAMWKSEAILYKDLYQKTMSTLTNLVVNADYTPTIEQA